MGSARGATQGPAGIIALAVLAFAIPALVRLALLAVHRADLSELAAGELAGLLWVGARLDGVVAGYLLVPLTLLGLLPGLRRLLPGALAAGAGLLVAAGLGELRFFEYYGFRPNYLVLEHGSDPEVLAAAAGEVGALGLFVLAAAIAAGVSAQRGLVGQLARILPGATRPVATLALLPIAALLARGSLDHRPLNPSFAYVTANRTANEIAASGLLNVAYEAAHLRSRAAMRLELLHPSLPEGEAQRRVRALLAGQGAFSADAAGRFVRRVTAPSPRGGPLNVVVVVMESFTGRLIGSLGGEPALSPELDALAADGLLLTHCYATGERTVQGLEAVTASFPPLPGDSIVRRPEARGRVDTLASLLSRRGYDTLFLYGGQGVFDSMRGFFVSNGYRRFIEERDFQDPSFRGAWGVSDEDLFRRANLEFQERWERGRPFFATLLTVSLHSPWEYPPGRAPELPDATRVPAGFSREELGNFLYADFAVGEFIREARGLGYFQDTLFVFIGDHGVHLRGRELVPSEEYRVPALLYAPGRVAPGRIEGVTSQMDIAPTILGLVGGEFNTGFFGRDVRASDGRDGLALLVYNKRDYGVRRADRLTVLRAGGARVGYRLAERGLEPSAESAEHREDAQDALALLQVAEKLLVEGRYAVEN